jgi:hypothetical protein
MSIVAAIGSGTRGVGRTGAAGASGTEIEMASVIFSSSGLRGPACIDNATNRESTSSDADNDAAAACARSIGGNALVGRELEHAATMSLMACCSSSLVR